MSNTHETNASELLQASDTFDATIEKLTALSVMVTEIIADDYIDDVRDKVRLGVSKMFREILTEMETTSDVLWQVRQSQPKPNRLRNPHFAPAAAPETAQPPEATGTDG